MRERTLLLGGTFQLKGGPEEGVRIRIEIPLSRGARVNEKAYKDSAC